MKLLRWTVNAVILATIVFGAGFLVFVYSIHRTPPHTTEKADGIVVLTGGTERIAAGIRLLAQGRGDRLLISGVNVRTTSEELARRSPGNGRLFKCCIDVGYKALDTIGNAAEAREWVNRHGFETLIVVTSSYHMPRSMAELHRALPGVELRSYAVVPASVRADDWYMNPGTAKLLLWEYAKLVPAATRYYVGRLFVGGADRTYSHADTSG